MKHITNGQTKQNRWHMPQSVDLLMSKSPLAKVYPRNSFAKRLNPRMGDILGYIAQKMTPRAPSPPATHTWEGTSQVCALGAHTLGCHYPPPPPAAMLSTHPCISPKGAGGGGGAGGVTLTFPTSGSQGTSGSWFYASEDDTDSDVSSLTLVDSGVPSGVEEDDDSASNTEIVWAKSARGDLFRSIISKSVHSPLTLKTPTQTGPHPHTPPTPLQSEL